MPKRFLVPALAAGIMVVGMLVGFQLKESIPNYSQDHKSGLDKFQEVVRFVNMNYFEPVNNDKLVDDAIRGLLEGLDPHSFYIPKTEMKEIEEQMQGSFEGIGVEFNIIDDTIFVVAPIAGGPSEKLGIMAGDRIVRIDGKNFAGVNITNNDVFKNLRGTKGTKVKISVKRLGVKDLIDFEITRDKIPVYSVNYSYMVDDVTGYMMVSRFAETTFNEFREHLQKLRQKGVKNLILDLRGNPGGYLDEARKMADAFVPGGKMLVYTEGRTPESKQQFISTDFINEFETGGVVVLIDQGSASASEIVSGAIQDHDRGIIVGTRSYGKGLVQTQHKLADGSAIRIVISRYFTPSGRCIQKPYNKSAKEYQQELNERYENGELFDESKVKFADSLKYKTKSGRTVYGGGGIMPDVFVARDTSGWSPYLAELNYRNIIRQFAVRYIEANEKELIAQYKTAKNFVEKFQVTDRLLKEMVEFANTHKIKYDEKGFNTSKSIIANNLKAFIGRNLFNEDAYHPVFLQQDITFKKALELMPEAIKLARTGQFTYKKK
jgi:carboxyl-terminal processing protease